MVIRGNNERKAKHAPCQPHHGERLAFCCRCGRRCSPYPCAFIDRDGMQVGFRSGAPHDALMFVTVNIAGGHRRQPADGSLRRRGRGKPTSRRRSPQRRVWREGVSSVRASDTSRLARHRTAVGHHRGCRRETGQGHARPRLSGDDVATCLTTTWTPSLWISPLLARVLPLWCHRSLRWRRVRGARSRCSLREPADKSRWAPWGSNPRPAD